MDIRLVIKSKHQSFSEFTLEAIRIYLESLRFEEGIKESCGTWSGEGHPELAKGTEAFIRKMRKGRRG
jgi:hypothetical protein